MNTKLERLSVRKHILLTIWAFILAVSIVIRCLPTLIYPRTFMEYLVVFTFTILNCVVFAKAITKLFWLDFVWLITPFFCLTGNVDTKYIFFTIISLVFYLIIRVYPPSISGIEYPLIIFGLVTSLVTWISFFAPAFYVNHILSMFPESKELAYSFLNRNMYHGFTNHYSRNAFYITVCILLVFSHILSKSRHFKEWTILLLFFMSTELLVAKRGLTLFVIVTMYLVYLFQTRGLGKKLVTGLRFVFIGSTLAIIGFMTLPGVSNIIVRLTTPNSGDDVSSGRFYLYGIAFKMFEKHPFLGNGWGSFLKQMAGTTFQGVHNDYIQFLAEIGIIGLLTMVVANFGSLFYTFQAFLKCRDTGWNNRSTQLWLTFSLSYQIFFIFYALTGLPHFSYEQLSLYLLLCGYGVGIRLDISQWRIK